MNRRNFLKATPAVLGLAAATKTIAAEEKPKLKESFKLPDSGSYSIGTVAPNTKLNVFSVHGEEKMRIDSNNVMWVGGK
jgi:hypothetical protein